MLMDPQQYASITQTKYFNTFLLHFVPDEGMLKCRRTNPYAEYTDDFSASLLEHYVANQMSVILSLLSNPLYYLGNHKNTNVLAYESH